MIPDAIKHLGHACIKFTNAGVSLTSDPFFYPAFLKSWFPYPDNRHLRDEALDSDYIYISHAHEDHFDRDFLNCVDLTRTTLIIPKFRSHYLEREVAKLGFTALVLDHDDTVHLPGDITVTMLIDQSHKEDSALLVDVGGFRFLNSNDCELAISDWPKGVDLLACQFSGAFWYPHCYDFSPDDEFKKTYQVRWNNAERLMRRVELTGAKSYLPSAGPAVFLDPALDRYNSAISIFPKWPDVAAGFRIAFPDVTIHPHLSNYENISEYRRKRRSEWGVYYSMPDKFVTEEELNAHLRTLQSYNKRFLKDWRKDVTFASNSWIAGDRRSWNVRMGAVAGELEESFNPEYTLNVPPRVLRAIVDGQCTWETALLSNRIRLRRDPDQYDNTFMGLLTYGDRPVQTLTMARQQEPKEFVKKDGYEFQRWCPHAGEDLTFATVSGGKLTCPRHEWCWDAKTGECLTGQGVPLKVRKIDD